MSVGTFGDRNLSKISTLVSYGTFLVILSLKEFYIEVSILEKCTSKGWTSFSIKVSVGSKVFPLFDRLQYKRVFDGTPFWCKPTFFRHPLSACRRFTFDTSFLPVSCQKFTSRQTFDVPETTEDVCQLIPHVNDIV